MDKVKREIAIDRDLAEAAERLGVDLGVEAERTLRRRLAGPDALGGEEREAIREQGERYERYVEQHGSFADEWRRF